MRLLDPATWQRCLGPLYPVQGDPVAAVDVHPVSGFTVGLAWVSRDRVCTSARRVATLAAAEDWLDSYTPATVARGLSLSPLVWDGPRFGQRQTDEGTRPFLALVVGEQLRVDANATPFAREGALARRHHKGLVGGSAPLVKVSLWAVLLLPPPPLVGHSRGLVAGAVG